MWWKLVLAYLLATPLVVAAVYRTGQALTGPRRQIDSCASADRRHP
jgi:hypothetical protein